MRTRTIAVFFGAVLAGASFASAQKTAPPAKKPAAAKPFGPLIRKDLLAALRTTPSPVRRNIFLPQGAGAPIVLPAALGGRPRPAVAPEEETPVDEAPPLIVRYVGFVRSQGKFLALVLVDGQAAALAEGDQAGAAGKVVRITAGEIEIQGSDGKSLKVPLEGERK
jgi:hypothetical protein